MTFAKWKQMGRDAELKSDWRRAIDCYQRAVQEMEAGREVHGDLAIYIRLGDSHLKLSEPSAAVKAYERGADLYADQGFLNNAIALYGKVLRTDAGRLEIYLRLAALHARKNVLIEAKRNLIEYTERMNAQGKREQAFKELERFADELGDLTDIRVMLAELFRAAAREDQARGQLAKAGLLPAETAAAGSAGDEAGGAEEGDSVRARSGLVFLDTGPQRAVELPPPLEPPPALPEEPATEPAAEAGGLLAGLLIYQPDEAEGGGEAASLGLEPTGYDGAAADVPAAPLEGLESASFEGAAVGADPGTLEGLERAEPVERPLETTSSAMTFESIGGSAVEQDVIVPPVEGLERTSEDLASLTSARADADLVLEVDEVLLEAPDDDLDHDPLANLELLDSDIAEPLGRLHAPPVPIVAEPPPSRVEVPALSAGASIEELEDRILDDPGNPALHRALAEVLVAAGDLPRAQEEFAIAVQGLEQAGDLAGAWALVSHQVALDPRDLRPLQKRVELAYQIGQRDDLVGACLALAEELGAQGQEEMARMLYARVIELDPGNVVARAGLPVADVPMPLAEAPPVEPVAAPPAPAGFPAPEPAPPPVAVRVEEAPPVNPRLPDPAAARGEEGVPPAFVDLGSLIIDEQAPRDTRMKAGGFGGEQDQLRDESELFLEMLAQFKKGIDENLDADDFQAHYELGIAFKEMGLLDEAIAEFQKALRAPEGRLRTSEALGVSFFEKGQMAVAEAVLQRAVEALPGGDEEKIGLIYWLGRAAEAQGKAAEAIRSYERTLAVDIRFKDVGDRIQRLTAGRQP